MAEKGLEWHTSSSGQRQKTERRGVMQGEVWREVEDGRISKAAEFGEQWAWMEAFTTQHFTFEAIKEGLIRDCVSIRSVHVNGDKSKILHTNCVGKGHHCFYFIRGDWLHWPRTVQVETRQSLERERRKAKEKGTAVRRLVASTLSKRIWHLKIRSAYYQCLTQEVTGNYGQT